jgi:hypothetical protein
MVKTLFADASDGHVSFREEDISGGLWTNGSFSRVEKNLRTNLRIIAVPNEFARAPDAPELAGPHSDHIRDDHADDAALRLTQCPT